MVLTMFFLGLVYVVFIAVLLVALGDAWPLAILFAGGFFVVQYFFSDRMAMFAMRGREVSPQQAPELHGMVDRLCAMSDMPKPRVAIANSDVPNAFATGRNNKRAVVCVTTGLMRRLDTQELEGVLAHEMSHVAHRDVAVMTIASFLGVLAGLLTRISLYSGLMRGGGRNQNVFVVVAVITLASVITYAVSFLLIRALSRYRELSADRAAALLTARPSALASALTKINGEMARIPTRDLRAAEPFNAFFFAPAITKGFSISSLFSTHPPLQKRLDQLADISGQLGRMG